MRTENFCSNCDTVINCEVDEKQFYDCEIGRMKCPNCGADVMPCNECDEDVKNYICGVICPYKKSEYMEPIKNV